MTVQRKFATILWGAILPLAIIVLWEVAARGRYVSPFLLPPFSKVAQRLWADLSSGELLELAGQTFWRLAISYVIAVVGGVVLGILMARVRVMRWLLDPILSIGLPAPKIAFLPIFVLWFGVFDKPKIIMTIFACIFPVIAGTWAGTQGVDKYLVWSAQNLGATPPRTAAARGVSGGAAQHPHRDAGRDADRLHRRGRHRDADRQQRPRRLDDRGGQARRLRRRVLEPHRHRLAGLCPAVGAADHQAPHPRLASRGAAGNQIIKRTIDNGSKQ